MGKNVLIIGASGGIGRAIAEHLGVNGYSLLLHYHQNREPLVELGQKLPPTSILMALQADLTCETDIKNLFEQIPFQIHAVIFASGISHHGLFQETDERTIDEHLAIHVKAPLLISQHVLKEMISRQSGHIIVISSIWGHVGASHEVVYSTVKGAQNSFIKALAKEVGPSGISVNGVSPGLIDTKMNDNLSVEDHEKILSDIPLQRMGSPLEVAYLIRFLLDEKSSYIQGEIIRMTGGWS